MYMGVGFEILDSRYLTFARLHKMKNLFKIMLQRFRHIVLTTIIVDQQ